MCLYAQLLWRRHRRRQEPAPGARIWYRKAAEAGDRRAADWCRKNKVPFTSTLKQLAAAVSRAAENFFATTRPRSLETASPLSL